MMDFGDFGDFLKANRRDSDIMRAMETDRAILDGKRPITEQADQLNQGDRLNAQQMQGLDDVVLISNDSHPAMIGFDGEDNSITTQAANLQRNEDGTEEPLILPACPITGGKFPGETVELFQQIPSSPAPRGNDRQYAIAPQAASLQEDEEKEGEEGNSQDDETVIPAHQDGHDARICQPDDLPYPDASFSSQNGGNCGVAGSDLDLNTATRNQLIELIGELRQDVVRLNRRIAELGGKPPKRDRAAYMRQYRSRTKGLMHGRNPETQVKFV